MFITSHDVFIGGLSRLMYSYLIILSQLVRPLVEELLYKKQSSFTVAYLIALKSHTKVTSGYTTSPLGRIV